MEGKGVQVNMQGMTLGASRLLRFISADMKSGGGGVKVIWWILLEDFLFFYLLASIWWEGGGEGEFGLLRCCLSAMTKLLEGDSISPLFLRPSTTSL